MIYDEKYWERLGDDTFQSYEAPEPMVWRKGIVMKELMSYDPCINNMLDVACCSGWYIKHLREQKFQAQYSGVDITPNLIQRAKDNNPNEQFQLGDIRSLKFDNDSFDLVFAGGVLMHLDPKDATKAMSELFRVSKKYVFIYTFGSLKETKVLAEKHFDVFYSLEDLLEMVPSGWDVEKKLHTNERWFLKLRSGLDR